jgi:hypothetical protein
MGHQKQYRNHRSKKEEKVVPYGSRESKSKMERIRVLVSRISGKD